LQILDENLKEYATDRQWEIEQAYCKHGSERAAAQSLGCTKSLISTARKAIRKKAAKVGYAPNYGLNNIAPPGFSVHGMSTLYDADGEKRIQWIKTSVEREQQEAIAKEMLAAMCEEIPRAAPTQPASTHRNISLANCYILTDYHLGMLSWPEETGEAWDTQIAENMLINWFAAAIQQAPKASVGVFAQLGDFLHWDGLEAVTPTSKHVLDADTRFQHVVRTAIRAIRRIIGMMLEKYTTLHIIMADANHDPASGVWLRELLAAMYEDEPRIKVDQNPDSYYCFEWGLSSLFFHHGHKRKPANVDDVFVAKFREVFGRTKFSYAHLGHLHHIEVKETNLMTVEQHRTLAAKDAYASRGGWLSGRSASVITYHKEYGEVGRVTLTPEMINEHTERDS